MRFATFITAATIGLLADETQAAQAQLSLRAMPQNEFDFSNTFNNMLKSFSQLETHSGDQSAGHGETLAGNLLNAFLNDASVSALMGDGHHGNRPQVAGAASDGIINNATKTVYPRVGKMDRDGQILTDGTVFTMTSKLVKVQKT